MMLDEIVAARRRDVEVARHRVSLDQLERSPLFAEDRRGFARALSDRPRAVIAEVKKASPSRGVIREEFDPVWIAGRYADSGAAAISVLTEERNFQGKLDDLAAIRAAVSVPLLRKDFIFDEYQVVEARAWGADAILLIAASLGDGELRRLSDFADSLDLDVLVEVHRSEELTRALDCGAGLVGVNSRDLRTFETRLEAAVALGADIPNGVERVAESGNHDRTDISMLERAGYSSFLVGESLMRATDPGRALLDLVGSSEERK